MVLQVPIVSAVFSMINLIEYINSLNPLYVYLLSVIVVVFVVVSAIFSDRFFQIFKVLFFLGFLGGFVRTSITPTAGYNSSFHMFTTVFSGSSPWIQLITSILLVVLCISIFHKLFYIIKTVRSVELKEFISRISTILLESIFSTIIFTLSILIAFNVIVVRAESEFQIQIATILLLISLLYGIEFNNYDNDSQKVSVFFTLLKFVTRRNAFISASDHRNTLIRVLMYFSPTKRIVTDQDRPSYNYKKSDLLISSTETSVIMIPIKSQDSFLQWISDDDGSDEYTRCARCSSINTSENSDEYYELPIGSVIFGHTSDLEDPRICEECREKIINDAIEENLIDESDLVAVII